MKMEFPINIIQKICYKTDNPLDHKRVSKTWYRALSQPHFWREFMCRTFKVDPKTLGFLRNYESDWRKSIELAGKVNSRKVKRIVKVKDWTPIQNVNPKLGRSRTKSSRIFLSNNLYTDTHETEVIDLGYIPIILRGIHFPSKNDWNAGKGLGQLTIPLCVRTQLLFDKFSKLEDELKKEPQLADLTLKSRIKKDKWFNVALEKRIGYLSAQVYNPSNCVQGFQTNRVATTVKLPKTFKWVTIARVTFGVSYWWRNHKYFGISISGLDIVLRPNNIPPKMNIISGFGGTCYCRVCRDEEKWELYQKREGEKLATQYFQRHADMIGMDSTPIESIISPKFSSSEDEIIEAVEADEN